MTENMKMLLEIVSEKRELAAKVGGGKAGEGEKTCACVMVGSGEYTHGDVRCICIIGGDGNW